MTIMEWMVSGAHARRPSKIQQGAKNACFERSFRCASYQTIQHGSSRNRSSDDNSPSETKRRHALRRRDAAKPKLLRAPTNRLGHRLLLELCPTLSPRLKAMASKYDDRTPHYQHLRFLMLPRIAAWGTSRHHPASYYVNRKTGATAKE